MKPYKIIVDAKRLKTYGTNTIEGKQGDKDSRIVNAIITADGVPLDLTNKTVTFYAIKPDKTKIFNSTTVKKASDGEVEFKLTTQVLAIEGLVKGELVVFGADGSKLTSALFIIEVIKSINDESAIESQNEFTLLTDALTKLTTWDNQFETKYNGLEQEYATELTTVKSQLAEIAHIVPNPDGINDRDIINDAIQFAHANNLNVLFPPNQKYLVSSTKEQDTIINIPGDNMTIDLNGSHIKLTPNGYRRYQLFYINGKNNIKIKNGIVQGDREEHDYSEPGTHEFGYGFSVRQSTATLEDLEVYDMTGDAIIITDFTSVGDGLFEDGVGVIRINRCHLHHCDRQGITVLEANEVYVDNVHIHDIYGVNPQACIDLEPATRTKRVNKFHLSNSVLEKAGNAAIGATGSCLDFKVSDCKMTEKIMIGDGIRNPRFLNSSFYMHKTHTEYATPYANKESVFENCSLTFNRYNLFGTYNNCEIKGIESPELATGVTIRRNGQTKLNNTSLEGFRGTNKKALIFNMTNNEPDENNFIFSDVNIKNCDVDLQNGDYAGSNNYQPKIKGVTFIDSYLFLQRGKQTFTDCHFEGNEYRESPPHYTYSLIRLFDCTYKGTDTFFNEIRKDVFKSVIELDSIGSDSFGMSGTPTFLNNSYIDLKQVPTNANLENTLFNNSFIRVDSPETAIDFQDKLFNTPVVFNS